MKPKVGLGGDHLNPIPVASASWEVMSWDLIGPLPKSRMYDMIVTMVDTRTKAIKLEPANMTITAMGTVMVMKNRIFREEGLPSKVYSNWGPQFISRFMRELYQLIGVEGNPSTAYHRQTNGTYQLRGGEVPPYVC
jgi:hypothetical protein